MPLSAQAFPLDLDSAAEPEALPAFFSAPAARPIGRGALPLRRKAFVRAEHISFCLAAMDWLLAAAVMSVALAPVPDWTRMSVGLGLQVLAVALCLKVGLWVVSAYATAAKGKGVISMLGALSIAGVVASSLFHSLPSEVGSPGLAGTLILAFCVMAFTHVNARWAVDARVRAGDCAETAVVVGATEAARRFIASHKDGQKVRVVGVFDDRRTRAPAFIEGAPMLGTIDDLLTWDGLPLVDHIVLSVSPAAEARARAIIARLRLAPNQVSLLMDFDGWTPEAKGVQALGATPAVILSGKQRPRGFLTAKRAADLVIASLALVAFAPVMAIVAAAVRWDSQGPILFRQRREGLNNTIITVLKFRTMREAPSTVGAIQQVEVGDPRVTRVGRFLRATSLDELPQLFNVLMGEMSLVGPRPHAIGMRTGSIDTCKIVTEYAHRHRLKPGITGWAQVNGSRGPVHTDAEVRERIRLDLEYIERASFWFDMWILLRTVPSLLGDKHCAR